MRLLVVLLLLAALPAQLPPPSVALCHPVGLPMQQQGGAAHGSTRIGAWAFAEEAGASPLLPPGNAILTGGRLWLVAHGLDPAHPSPLQLRPHGSGCYLFLIAPRVTASVMTMPGAALGHDRLFVDPRTMATAIPWVSFALIECSPFLDLPCAQLVVPVLGYEQHWLPIDIPNDPSLSGSVYSIQSLHADGVLVWLSPELGIDVR